MGMLAIIVSLLLLMLLAYRGISVLLLAPLMAALAVLLSGDGAFLLPIYTNTFMGALGNYVMQFFPLFLLGALFGQLMADSGAAQSISNGIVKRLGTHHVVLTVVMACAVLTMAASRCSSWPLPFTRSAVSCSARPMCPSASSPPPSL